MSAIDQSNSKALASPTSANDSVHNDNTSGNPLVKTPNSSNLKPDEPHPLSAEKFDAEPAKRSQRSGSWYATMRLRAGHFLLGYLGVAAFRAAYITARGNIGNDRVGLMQVRFDPGLKQPGRKAGGRTREQARIANSAQLVGACVATHISIITGLVGGLCGLGARARRAYQLWRMRDDKVYTRTRNQLIRNAMMKSGFADLSQWSEKTNHWRDVLIAEVVKKEVDSWRKAHQNDPATPVTEANLKRKITAMVNEFAGLATAQAKTFDQTSSAAFRRLAEQWDQSTDNDAIADQITGIVEKWAVHHQIQNVCNSYYDRLQEDYELDLPEVMRPAPLKMTPQDFQAAYTEITDHAFQDRRFLSFSASQAYSDANNEIKSSVLRKLDSQPRHSIFKIMISVPENPSERPQAAETAAL